MICLLAAHCLLALPAAAADKRPQPSPVERYAAEAKERAAAQSGRPLPGSLWYPGALLSDIARDPKASQVDDLVTILVAERASAASTGATKTARKSAAESSVGALFGRTRATGPLANITSLSSSAELDSEGSTTRDSVLSTTLSARVVDVLPNGYLVVEGTKETLINSERQVITVRGVARPLDITPGNIIRSDRLAQLEVRINGKGVVGDAIRRPSFLYRLLLGILPF